MALFNAERFLVAVDIELSYNKDYDRDYGMIYAKFSSNRSSEMTGLLKAAQVTDVGPVNSQKNQGFAGIYFNSVHHFKRLLEEASKHDVQFNDYDLPKDLVKMFEVTPAQIATLSKPSRN